MQSRRREIERRLSRPLILCYDMRRAAPVAAGQATSISHVFSVERMAVPSFWGRLFSWPDVQTKGYRRDDKCHKVDHGADNLVIAHRLTSNSRRRWPPPVSSRIARLPSDYRRSRWRGHALKVSAAASKIAGTGTLAATPPRMRFYMMSSIGILPLTMAPVSPRSRSIRAMAKMGSGSTPKSAGGATLMP